MILECNGGHVELSAIAKKIASLTRTCGNRHFPIIVQFDREKRQKTVQEIRVSLISELSELNMDQEQFRFGISDRDMECWILYATDEHGNLDFGCNLSIEDEHEGKSGEYILRQRLQNKGKIYHKTTSGVELFTKISPAALAAKSSSFREFFEVFDFDCHWMTT